LKRTFCCIDGTVTYLNGSKDPDVKQKDVGIPDYSDLLLDDYLSVIEIANPMHRLWSDGRWNKLTLAHGCYWGKCTFCDISLSYIKDYEATTAPLLVDRIEAMIKQTGNNGFHFVDEAAPPALMRDVAIEIIRRDLTVVWWTNIRFEKSFTKDLCQLLVRSGCIAVSGGLEVASDRLLELISSSGRQFYTSRHISPRLFNVWIPYPNRARDGGFTGSSSSAGREWGDAFGILASICSYGT
jgi:radical SAM superfamily enzyme YgiQ (UPF0313 family)